MAALVTSAGIGGTTTTLTSAAPSPDPSGSDRYMLGVACGFVAGPSAFKYGGSGGTDLTQIGSDFLLGGVIGGNFWGIAPGPTGTTSAYSSFGATSSNALSAGFYSGVDQTTPHEGLQTNTGDNGGFPATAVATITVTGTESGQKVEVPLAFGVLGGPTLVSVVAGDDTTVVRSDWAAPAGENQCGTALMRGTASGSTLTLSATITVSSTFGSLYWIAGALPLVDASGGAINGELTQTLGALTSSATGTVALTGTTAATLGAMLASGAAGLEVDGTLSATLGAMTAASTGTVALAGTLGATLGAMTLAATGELTAAGTGTLAATLGELTAAATGTNENHGALAATLGAMTLEATGTAGGTGELTATLGAMTLAATGELTGTPAQTLGGGGLAARDIAEQERLNRDALRRKAARLAEEAREKAEAERERAEAVAARLDRLAAPRGRSSSPQLRQLLQAQVAQSQVRVANYSQTAEKAEKLAEAAPDPEIAVQELRRQLKYLACLMLLEAVL